MGRGQPLLLIQIGQQVALESANEGGLPFTIVGVVRDSKYSGLREATALPMVWVPLAQAPLRIRSVLLRVQPGMESAVLRQARAIPSSIDPNLMVRKTATLASLVQRTSDRERLMLGLSAGFGSLALLLAAIALYGTVALQWLGAPERSACGLRWEPSDRWSSVR